MFRRTLILPLFALGVVLVWSGLNRWLDHSESETTAIEYVQAVMRCDEEAILRLTHPTLRNRIKQELADAAFQNTQEPGEYKIAIHHTILTGPEDSLSVLLNEGRLDEETAQKQAAPTMLVNVIIEQNGYQLKPDVHLERAQDGLWYVTWLEGLDVDPRWFDQQDAAKVPAEEMRKVSEELHDALQQKADANNDPAP